jgi:hypothetical protein
VTVLSLRPVALPDTPVLEVTYRYHPLNIYINIPVMDNKPQFLFEPTASMIWEALKGFIKLQQRF